MAAFISHILPGFHRSIVEKGVTGRQNLIEWDVHTVCELGESSSRKATVGFHNLKRCGATIGLVALLTSTGLPVPNVSLYVKLATSLCLELDIIVKLTKAIEKKHLPTKRTVPK